MGTAINNSNIRGGMTIDFRGTWFEVVNSQHIKPGKGGAFTKVRAKNLETGRTIDITLKPVDKVEQLFSEQKNMEYLYRDGDSLVLMDNETYEQEMVPAAMLGDQIGFLKENTIVEAKFVEEKLIGFDLPKHMVLEITKSDPGVKGDTATNTTKPATLETGAEVQVPLFINEGEMIRVDTRTGEYIERAN